jgi:SSS family solute:Na+ symporter
LLSNIWVVQILPAVFIGLYTNWLHQRALIAGLLGGLIVGTWMVVTQDFQSSVYVFHFGSFALPTYAAVAALIVNLLICVTLTFVFNIFGVANGNDETTPLDFEARPVPGLLRRSHVQTPLHPTQPYSPAQNQQPIEAFSRNSRPL